MNVQSGPESLSRKTDNLLLKIGALGFDGKVGGKVGLQKLGEH